VSQPHGEKKELVVANWQRKAITVASKAIKAGQGQDYRRQEERRGVDLHRGTG